MEKGKKYILIGLSMVAIVAIINIALPRHMNSKIQGAYLMGLGDGGGGGTGERESGSGLYQESGGGTSGYTTGGGGGDQRYIPPITQNQESQEQESEDGSSSSGDGGGGGTGERESGSGLYQESGGGTSGYTTGGGSDEGSSGGTISEGSTGGGGGDQRYIPPITQNQESQEQESEDGSSSSGVGGGASGGTVHICTDPTALNYTASFGVSDQTKCVYASGSSNVTGGNNETAPLQNTSGNAASNDCPYFSYANVGSTGLPVKKIQTFLNQYMNAHLVVDSYYGSGTEKAVDNFQELYASAILAPWSANGPTGWFYKTTAGAANIIVGCSAPNVYLEGPNVVHSFSSFVPNPALPKVGKVY